MIEYSAFITLSQDYKTTYRKIGKSFNPVSYRVFTESIIIMFCIIYKDCQRQVYIYIYIYRDIKLGIQKLI